MFTESLMRRTARRVIGTIDALAAPHGIDRYIEQVAPLWSTTEVRGRVVEVDRSAAGSIILTIEANGGWTGFAAGQYTQLSVEIDGVRHTRCYSMASAAGNSRRFQLGIKAHPHGIVSQYLVARAETGTIVGLTPAAGDFHLPAVRPTNTLLISGGSGITPVMAMLRTLCAEGHNQPVTFLHYATTPDAMLFRDEITAIEQTFVNVHVVTAFSQAPLAGQLTGLLDHAHLDAADPDWRQAQTFVCGPASLMDSARGLFDAAGCGERFHQEAFALPQFVGEAGTVGGSVRFSVCTTTVDNDGQPLLVQAEAAGLTPQSGCRMGICHTCIRSLSCGTVRDTVTGELTTATTSDVEIRICVSVPVGDVAVDL
jgi:ferredoxin-NADP reductase